MTLTKDPSILDLLSRLRLASRGWEVVDHWKADLRAIGIATKHEPRRLVYVSTFSRDPGCYDYECEAPGGPDADDYATTESAENVDYPTLVKAMEAHLNRDRDD